MKLFEGNKYFQNDRKPENKKAIKDRKIYLRFLDKQYNRVSNIDELLGKLPEKNEQIRIITQKSFNAFAILLYIAEKVDIEELILGIYRIDKNSVNGIKELFYKGVISKITIVLSSFFDQTKKAEIFAEMLSEFARENKNVRLVFCWNHTKIMGVKTRENKYYVVEGSGNLSNNAMIEQYLFEQSEQSFNFHKSWMEELLELDKN